MNIFVVDEDPVIAAKNLCDKHVVKMIVEGCQMLSTVHRMHSSHVIYAPVELYKESFRNHPCTIWARESTENYMEKQFDIIEEQLEKEKQQIIDAYYDHIDGVYSYREAGERYYNQTYIENK